MAVEILPCLEGRVDHATNAADGAAGVDVGHDIRVQCIHTCANHRTVMPSERHQGVFLDEGGVTHGTPFAGTTLNCTKGAVEGATNDEF